jgi:HemY protein
MRRLFVLLVVLIVAILIGLQIKTHPGYVIISLHKVSIETRLWFAIVALVVSFLVLHSLLRLINLTGSLPSRWRRWRRREKAQRVSNSTYQGLMDLAEGEWKRAQKQLLKQVKNAPAPLVNYLSAAIAAQRNGEQDKRDDYLHQAAMRMPKAKLAIGLVQAQLQYEAAQYEQALATLQHLSDIAPRQKQVLALLAKVYKKLADWQKLMELLPIVQHHKALPESYITKLAQQAYCHLFKQIDELPALKRLWHAAPKTLREQTAILALYLRGLIRLGANEEAEKLCRQALKDNWDSPLAGMYGSIDCSKKQLAIAEGWHKHHPKDAQLLFTLARLAQANQLWGKAKDYYEDSLALAGEPKVYAAFAAMLEQQGEVKSSLVYYRKGLKASFFSA